MSNADHKELAAKGRNFNCVGCKVQKLRRCQDDRWDFTENDANFFPMRIHDGGELFGFCPGKATWDQETAILYRSLIVSRTCGIMWEDGSLSDQPGWWVNLLSWFIQKYDHELFASRARMVLGDGKQKPGKGSSKNGSKSR